MSHETTHSVQPCVTEFVDKSFNVDFLSDNISDSAWKSISESPYNENGSGVCEDVLVLEGN